MAVLVIGLVADVSLLVTGSTNSPWASSWDPRVLGIVHFVEVNRGLRFEHPVRVEFLTVAQFDKAIAQPVPTSAADRRQLDQALGELRALGLVTGTVNLAASANTLQQSDVVGLYREDRKTVYVRGATLTPYVRVTLAHELTHALQDQYFDLGKLQRAASQGDDNATTALVEGDAVRIQNLYEQSMSQQDRHTYQQESSELQARSTQASSVPEILSDFQEFPYAFGVTYVDALHAQGGDRAIDQAFEQPPTTEAQIVDPSVYPLNWTPLAVAPPAMAAGDRRLEAATPFGQISLFEVLGSRLGYNAAWTAVHGWQGDNSVVYSDQARTCIAIAARMLTDTDTSNLADASRQWAKSFPGATVSTAGRLVTIRSCDPGPTAPPPPTITPSVFDVLSSRSAIIDEAITQASLDFATSACVADHVLSGLGPNGYGELIASNISETQQQALQQLTASSVVTCRNE